MPAPLLLDLTHTAHTTARTGIQRVARRLLTEFTRRGVVTPITFDPFEGLWRALEPWEIAQLASTTVGRKRSARWPWTARWRGRLRKVIGPRPSPRQLSVAPGTAFLEPELFSAATARRHAPLFDLAGGPRVAIFCDAIALKFPELTPAGTVARFPSYLQELARFDAIAAISGESRDTLADYWRWLGLHDAPPVEALPLGIDLPSAADRAATANAPASAVPVVLCVCTLEGRKNHLTLLEASEQLWARGARFELRLIGMANAETGRAALSRIGELQTAGRPLRYDGAVADAVVTAAYRECAFTVYPSLIEGFGLPVLESVAYGKPCICADRGVLGESARGGGCVALPRMEPAPLAEAMERLLNRTDELATLAAAARVRPLKSWSDYTDDMLAWLPTVRRRK
ncbi:MAG: glycosyltransferase [Opitutae bacterium]|nr:glycosyltransferase [Opitutae bacterium]